MTDLATELSRELRTAATDWANSRPRSLQVAVGPSEIGSACDRQLAYKALGTPASNTEPSDTWPSTVGTAVHDYVLADALSKPGVGVRGLDHPLEPDELAALRAQLAEQGGRWIVEQKVQIAPGVKGSTDVFDVLTGTVVDHKVLGADSHRETRLRGAKQQYRVQSHLYGFGWAQLGFDVRHVAIAAWPRSGFTTGLHIWTEPYDEQVVEDALARWFRIVDGAPGLSKQPILFDFLPTADAPCSWCDFRNPALAATVPGAACAGHPQHDDSATPPSLHQLIA
jgi:hypothetical protein